MNEFTKLIEFRQALYNHGFTRARDAQFELLDALLLSPPIRSYPELSLSPVFRRKWASIYAAIECGRQDLSWLESYVMQQIPTKGPRVFALDVSCWPHPAAKALADRQYVYSPTAAVDGGSVVAGHPYSALAWVPERGCSWALPVSMRRIASQQTDVEVGVKQVKQLCHCRETEMAQSLSIITGDGKYGNCRFFGPLRDEPCAVVARMRRDRVLYREPGPYGGRGRPAVHGNRFAFKESETWDEPDAVVELEDERWGRVRLRRWDHLHARQDVKTSISVILVETHLEREKPLEPFWLGYQAPPDQQPGDQRVDDLWRWYQHRWPVEPSFRFRKQYLHWTLPRFQTPECCDRWTMLLTLAQWQLFFAREVVQDAPLPWQPTQKKLTPERVLQGFGGLFGQIDTPARPPQPRGNSPGWPKGRPRTRPKRHRVVKKTQKRAKAA